MVAWVVMKLLMSGMNELEFLPLKGQLKIAGSLGRADCWVQAASYTGITMGVRWDELGCRGRKSPSLVFVFLSSTSVSESAARRGEILAGEDHMFKVVFWGRGLENIN